MWTCKIGQGWNHANNFNNSAIKLNVEPNACKRPPGLLEINKKYVENDFLIISVIGKTSL